jgi:diphosphomevalonate decarboxylase
MHWVRANSNLAFVKYWGKAPQGVNRAASGSISVTLDGLSTVAGVSFESGLGEDEIGAAPAARPAVAAFLDRARSFLGENRRARVRLASNFPVAAGLASSASVFAALAMAVAEAAGRELPPQDLAALARAGSGSACRSLHGGFVEWIPDARGDRVEPLAPPEHWPLAILVAITSPRPKAVGSREGMNRTAATSPYYSAWLACGARDLGPVREAIRRRDLPALGEAIERNCLRMHAAAIAAEPPLLYWEPATLGVIRAVWAMRSEGTGAWFSIDAGPQVKVLCEPYDAEVVAARLRAVEGVVQVLRSRPGGGPQRLEGPPAWAGTEAAGSEAS